MDEKQRDPSIYEPIFVSIGPYHHGKQEFRRAEAFKYQCLERFGPGKDLLYECVMEKIDEIRDCYAQVSIVSKYDDNALAWMMVLDSNFIITYMETTTTDSWDDWFNCLGLAATRSFVARDVLVIENQIPFFVVKLLIGIKYEKEQGKDLVNKFIAWFYSIESKDVRIPREDEDPPIHFLEALRRVLVEDSATEIPDRHHRQQNHSNYHLLTFSPFKNWPKFMEDSMKKKGEDTINKPTNDYGWRSVMDLKAKGISFLPSSSHSLTDIKFISRPFYGQLQLPVRTPSDRTPAILSNMIAYEISPDHNRNDQAVVLSYTIFMKSLIQTVNDVKELQKSGVFLFNRFSNQKKVVELFKNINTFGVGNMNIYEDVMHGVGKHCNNLARTWMADLVHGKLSSPWTIMGLLSATLLIILTFLQTMYTIYPV